MTKRIFLLAALLLASLTNNASATPLDGTATVLAPDGSLIIEHPVTGDLDLVLNTMSVDPSDQAAVRQDQYRGTAHNRY